MSFIINGERIEDDVIEEEFEGIKQHYEELGEVVCCDRDEEFMEYARNNVVNRTLLLQESLKKFGPPSDGEVESMIDFLKEEHGGEEEFYEKTGYSSEDESEFRGSVSNSISVDKILEEAIGQDPDPPDEELEAYYRENIDRYLTEEEVRVSQIFVVPASHQAAKESFQQLREARERLLDGADFDRIALEVGDKVEDEIDLGFYKRGETMPELEAITFSMRDGEISPVVATHYGFHIFKVTGRRKPGPIPFEELRDEVGQHFLQDRRERLMNKLIDSLKARATIEEVEIEPKPV